MRADFERLLGFIVLVKERRRVSVATIQDELGVSRDTVYRMVRAAVGSMPLRLESGVVIYSDGLDENNSN